ncbi:DUF6234 family protein [Streptomyces sp. NBC_01176]|uniref:DUF6234 family protein n=1 Tax=Streptomyces sp. NBC_01176 TaxID=2903760 RepID=UPI00386CEBAD|nr:DUF6234 family protein [Streptomyces sp. NBC_01176]
MTPSPESRRRPSPFADVVLALVLLVVDAVAAVLALVSGLDAAGYAFFDTGAGTEAVSVVRPVVYVSAVGALVLVSAVVSYRGGAIVTTCVQSLAGLSLVLGVVIGLSAEHGGGRPPAPSPGHSGPQSQCRSGGDNSECLGS